MHQWWRSRWKHNKIPVVFLLTVATVLVFQLVRPSVSYPSEAKFPDSKLHPLPTSLSQWQNQEKGDYFDQVQASPNGYLVWSQFPIKVYLEPPVNPQASSASSIRAQQWQEAVKEAIAEWNTYLPLVEVKDKDIADIVIWRSPPARKVTLNRATGLYDIPRAKTAQTRYQFYLQSGNPPILAHRMEVEINPEQSQQSILAATRHELGHALGIWGHSPQATDALYFSQVRNPPKISPRDINTLIKIYQQPTKLGWKIPS